MKTRTTSVLAAATLTGILLAGTACGAPKAATQAAATTPAAVTSATAEPSPTSTSSAAASSAPIVIETPKTPALTTFTFPDGHVSFTHPAGWTVKTQPGPALNPEQQKHSFDAVITDQAGEVLAHVLSGTYGDGASGPVARTVLDHAPVPGIHDERGEPTELGFAYDQSPGGTSGPYYFMDVRRASEFLTDLGSSGSNQVLLPNGVMTARVVLGEPGVFTPAFASPAAAKTWMGTEQYGQLKAMLLSLNYS